MTDRPDADLGEPIAELSELAVESSEGLVGRVVSSVRRRHFTSQLATLWWSAAGEAFIEVIRLVSGLARAGEHNEGGTEG